MDADPVKYFVKFAQNNPREDLKLNFIEYGVNQKKSLIDLLTEKQDLIIMPGSLGDDHSLGLPTFGLTSFEMPSLICHKIRKWESTNFKTPIVVFAYSEEQNLSPKRFGADAVYTIGEIPDETLLELAQDPFGTINKYNEMILEHLKKVRKHS